MQAPCPAELLLPCADYFKVASACKDAVGNAIDIITFFLHHTVPEARLKEKQRALLNRTIHLCLPVLTRWGSYHHSFKQLLATERAMRALALESGPDIIASVGPKSRAKAERLLEAIGDSTLWARLKAVVDHLGPILVSARTPHRGPIGTMHHTSCTKAALAS